MQDENDQPLSLPSKVKYSCFCFTNEYSESSIFLEQIMNQQQETKNTRLPMINLAPTWKKAVTATSMALVCVFVENALSWHSHGATMIALHLPVAYLHESIAYKHKNLIRASVLWMWWFILFHGWIHRLVDYDASCWHDHALAQEWPVHFGAMRMQQLHTLKHQPQTFRTATNIIAITWWALAEELVSLWSSSITTLKQRVMNKKYKNLFAKHV